MNDDSSVIDGPLGYEVVGGGRAPAMKHLNLGNLGSASVAVAVSAIYEAKKRSEAVKGIGRETDLVVLRPGKPAYLFKKEDFTTLDAAQVGAVAILLGR